MLDRAYPRQSTPLFTAIDTGGNRATLLGSLRKQRVLAISAARSNLLVSQCLHVTDCLMLAFFLTEILAASVWSISDLTITTVSGRGRSQQRNSASSAASTASDCSTVDDHWHHDTRSGDRAEGSYSRHITRAATPDRLVQAAYFNVSKQKTAARAAKKAATRTDTPDFAEYSRLAGDALKNIAAAEKEASEKDGNDSPAPSA